MTLVSFVRHYVYLPMIGLTRNPYLAGIATFAVMGLWHEIWPAHWLFWGIWHGMGLAVLLWWSRFRMKRKIKLPDNIVLRVAGWVGTMAYVVLGGAFTAGYGRMPVIDSFRLIFAAFGIT
jgi:alginate O-acetyltransferase complex protein AlgI